MPRGTVLTPEVERLIGDVYIKHPELRAKTQRFYEEVYRRVHERINWAEPNWPGLSVVKKRLATLREKDRNRPAESTELDEEWSLCSLPKYPIPAEALPLIMSICEKCLCDLEMGGHHSEFWHLTVREALWIGRLCKVLEFYYSKQMARWADPSNAEQKAATIRFGALPENYREIKFEDIVLDWAYAIASAEEYSEIEGKSFEEGEFDVHLMANIFEYCGERQRDYIDNIAEWYGIDPNVFIDLTLSIADIEQTAVKAFIESRNLQLFQIPKAEIGKLSHEAREALDLDSAVPILGRNRDKIVIVPAKRDTDDELLGRLSKYSVDIKYAKEREMEVWGAWGIVAAIARNIIGKEDGGTE